MSRLIIAMGLMTVASVVSFIAGFTFSQWGYEEQRRKERGQWN